MKKLNLIKRLWTDSHEKQSPQRFARYAAILIMLLTLGVGQMWGMTFGASTIYFDNTNANFTNPCLYIWNGGYNETWQMTKVSGSDCYWTYTRSSAFNGDGFLFKDKNTWIGQSSNITDSYNSGWWTNCYSKELGWRIVGPKSMSMSNTTETEAGSGTSGSKYIVKEGTKITVSASGTMIDPNHTVEYKFNDGSWSTKNTYTVVNSAVAATDYSVTVYVRTKRGDLTSREFNLGTIYYRGETKYSVKAVASPVAGGSVTPTSNTAMGQYTGGTITASENTGYTFTGWTGGSGTYADASEETTTFKPTAASTVTANFSENMSTVTLTASPSGKGSFTIGGAAATSTTAGVTTTRSVTAVPIAGYSFSGWSITGGATISSTTANLTTVTGAGAGAAATLTATFVEDLTYYDVTFAVGTGYTSLGSISAMNNTTSSAISSGDDILSASNITFTATPNTGYTVDGFYSDASCETELQSGTTTTYTIASLSADVDVYVKFIPITYTITYNLNSGSNPGGAPTSFTIESSDVTLPTPTRTGYTFNGWYANSGLIGDPVAKIVSGSTGNKEYWAKWSEKMTTVTISASPAGSATFTVNSVSGTSANVGVTTTKTIVATALNSDFTFGSWSATNCSASPTNNKSTTLSGNGSSASGTLVANMTLVPCSLLYGADTKLNSPTNGGAMSYDISTHAYYKDVTTNSSPYCFRFSHNDGKQYSGDWNGYPDVKEAVPNGDKIDCDQIVQGWDNKASIKYTGASGNTIRIWFDYANKKAWITEQTYSVTINNGDHGIVSPNGVRSVGASGLTITATPAEGYKFASWSVTGGASVASSTSATTTLTATADGTVAAIYETESPIRLYYSNPAGWSPIYAYLWDVDNTSDKNANWPGTDITTNIEVVDCQQFYYYEYYPSAHAGWDRIIFNGGDGTKQTGNITFSAATNAGQYNNAGKDATGSWQNPTNPWYFAYDGDSWSTTAHPLTCTSVTSGYVELDLAANTDYAFKFVENGSTWYGCTTATKITYENKATAQTMNNTAGGSADQTIKTAVAGTYRFTWDITNKRVTVTYPDSYKITFGMGTGGATITASATSAGGSFSSGDYVGSGADVTFTQTASTGYTFAGWYTTKDAGGSVVSGMGISNNVLENVTTNKTVWSRYTENKTAITITTDGHGTITTPNPNESPYSLGVATMQNINASANTGYHWNTWTVSGTAALNSSAATQSNKAKGDGTVGGTGTVTATFSPNTYRVHFHRNGGAGEPVYQNFTYDVAQNLTANSYTRTGYTFAGWATSTSGEVVYANGANVSNLTAENGVDFHLYAKWTPNPYTVVLDKQTSAEGYGGNAGTVTNQTVTFNATPATVSGSMPSAANGYAFMGFYSATGGNGRRFIDPSGNWVTSAGDTISGGKWVKPDGITLYAYYKKAEITALTLDATVVETNATVGVTPTISPAPEGTTKLCFYVFYGNDNPLDPQPPISWNGTKATFKAGETSGTYKIGVSLRTGTECGGGTLLDSTTISYQVAGTHTVTVRYKCGDEVIKAASSLEGIRPLDWSDEITAPDIIGYSFTGWSAGDGVSLTDDDGAHTKTSTTEADIKIKAVYDGYLTANYSKKRIIYFNNTLNWDTVVVYFYKNSSYWGNTQGSGANTTYMFTNTPYSEGKHGGMKRVAPGSNIWYFDAEAAGVNASYQTVVFTDKDQHGCNYFYNNVKVIKRDDYYSTKLPMFVPVASQTPDAMNSNTANYYNKGYWMNYPENTGYTLKIYNKKETDGATELKSIPFNFTENKTMPMELDVDLEAGLTYGFKIYRNDGQNDGAGSFFGNTGTMTANTEGWDMTTEASSNTGLQTTAAGSYKFILNYYAVSSTYHYRVSVTYPVTTGDYRLIYKDNVHLAWHPSAVIPKANAKDTVSFFVRKGQAAILKLQKCTGLGAGTVTWTDTVTWWNGSSLPSAITQDSVYNICLKHNASTGKLEIENIEAYTGNYYIRVDAANSKWDNYRTDPDHLMTYSEYSINHGGYSHYYCHWVQTDDRKNIKFTIANDYSPCISDTLARETASGDWANITNYVESNGDLKRNANVRFMWNRHDNTIKRAYVDGAQEDGSEFLLMLNTDSPNRIRWADESALTSDKVTFSDNGNWIYEANIQAKPNAQIKLKSTWGTGGTAIVQYFKGSSSTSEDMVGGSGDTWYDIRVIYDFKTNRLVASYIPRGKIDDKIEINADVMFIREHQGDIAQLTFGENGAIKKIETAYGVLRFNKWTLNNKEKTGTHEPLASPKSRYERDLFYVSFPFRVSMEEVFGFGTYGTHWIIEYYDGAGRATNGYWLESGPNWKFIWDRKNQFFEPNQGYIIALELDELGESSSVWANTEQVELYFPSYGTMPDITKASVNCTIPEHTCTINRSGGALGPEYDRRVKDSHWNVISVPTYVNTNNPTFANTDWITTADETHVGPNFLYEWNPDDNSVTARSGIGYNYQAMHAYLVQYCGAITWTSSVSPAAAPRRNPAYRGEYEFRLEMMQNDQVVDQTYVKLSDDEHVTTGFEFNYDMSKEFNKSKANIYTLIGTEPVAGNVLPMTDQTTVVPVGVKIATTGDYTFSMPNGTYGVGVTLIDNETGIRTSLSALDYAINLSAGEYTNRFFLEISPIKPVATGVEQSQMTNHQSQIKKVLVDGLLYIVKDGKVFDAHGNRVK